MRKVKIIPALFLLLSITSISIYSIYFQLYRHFNIPSEKDWDTAAQWIQTHWKEGDVIVLAPEWISELGKLGGRFSGREIHSSPKSSNKRVWVMSVFKSFKKEAHRETRLIQRIGKIDLYLVESTS